MTSEPSAMEERLVELCNRLAEGLEVNVADVGAERFVAVLTDALSASGLRIALYDHPPDAGGAD